MRVHGPTSSLSAIWALALAVLCVLATAPHAVAQTYPTRAVRVISPNPPGGANDTVARMIADKLSDKLGQRFVIDNRGGAGGIIGGELAAAAAPDGYTLLAGSVSTHTFAPIIQPSLKYDPVKSFAPVSLFALVQNLLVVNPATGVGSVKELVAFAKSKPQGINYSSGGPGSTSHFAVAMFVATAGIGANALHIPHKGGAPALQAVATGDVDFYFGPSPGMVPIIKAGRAKAIAVSGPGRFAALPDVPTVAEAGLPDYRSLGWFGLLAPAGTSPEIVKLLSQAVGEVVKADDIVRGFANQGIEPAANTPEAFATFIAEQLTLYRRLAKEHNLKLE